MAAILGIVWPHALHRMAQCCQIHQCRKPLRNLAPRSPTPVQKQLCWTILSASIRHRRAAADNRNPITTPDFQEIVMSRYFVSAIALAVAPFSLAAAEPAKDQNTTPPANCPHVPDRQAMHQSGDHDAMQHHMGKSPADGSAQGMQHGDHSAMGQGAHHGQDGAAMSGQTMQHGDHSAMGQGQHHAKMQGDGQCPALNQQEDGN